MPTTQNETGLRAAKKILYVTTVGGTMNFFTSLINRLVKEGHQVDIAANESGSKVPACYREWGCRVHPISVTRSPFHKGNLTAIRQLKTLVETEKYDIVHCHTPIAAMCTRLACRKARKQGTKVLYTAHGFHFYKGAPLKNWLLYYPVEKLCAYFTDVLITINREDFALAQRKMRAKSVQYVPGVGIDLEKFGVPAVDKAAKRRELGIPEDAVLLLSVGELNSNKNHETVIRAIAEQELYYIIAGKGALQPQLQSLIDSLGISHRVKLLGYRTDVKELYEAADLFVFPSFREGLSVSVMEAMASGLPCVASRIRGNTDLLGDSEGGLLCQPNDPADFSDKISRLAADPQLRCRMGHKNRAAVEKFGMESVIRQMQDIYTAALQK